MNFIGQPAGGGSSITRAVANLVGMPPAPAGGLAAFLQPGSQIVMQPTNLAPPPVSVVKPGSIFGFGTNALADALASLPPPPPPQPPPMPQPTVNPSVLLGGGQPAPLVVPAGTLGQRHIEPAPPLQAAGMLGGLKPIHLAALVGLGLVVYLATRKKKAG